MTCIGRPSLSSGRGAELVEAERGNIDASPSQSPYGDSSPPMGAISCPTGNSPCPPKGSLS